MNNMDWVNNVQKTGDYFNIVEGDNRFQILSHLAPLPIKWTGTTYEPAEEGDTDISIKGVGWVLQDGVIKLAKLPYTVVKAIKGLMEDEDYAFAEFPMPRAVNVRAIGAGTKEVEYSIIPSPKETPVDQTILDQLVQKPTPEEMVEKSKNKSKPVSHAKEELPGDGIPF